MMKPYARGLVLGGGLALLAAASAFAQSSPVPPSTSTAQLEQASRQLDALTQPDDAARKAQEKAASKELKNNEAAVKKALKRDRKAAKAQAKKDQKDPAKHSQVLGVRG